MELADKKACTGCGACAYVCPKKCILFNTDRAYGVSYPVIDKALCINCGKCRTSCPVLNPQERSEPMQAYAAWSSNEEERRTSASGGIAAEIYKYAIKSGWAIVGATLDENFVVGLKLADKIEAIKTFKNSKYVFCSTADAYCDIENRLQNGGKVVVIALPCQVAAFKKVFYKYLSNLLLVDLVCHGVTPYKFFFQHIKRIEWKYGERTVYISFRDPAFSTDSFTLTLRNAKNHCFYAKRSRDGDSYLIGYHGMITYRENCYHCPFAQSKRLSDITISDYKGLGVLTPPYRLRDSRNVSSVLINTDRGKLFLTTLIKEGKIVAEERPVEEPIKGDGQLQHPSPKSIYRKFFEYRIKACKGNFEQAMRPLVCLAILEKGSKKIARSIKKAFL